MAMTSARDAAGVALLASSVRRSIVDLLANHTYEEDEPQGLTAAQIADQLEMHVTTARFHLDQLVTAGILTAEFTRMFGVGRPRKVYAVAAGSFEDAHDHDVLNILANLLADAFGRPDLTPAQAGEEWARDHVPSAAEPSARTAGAWLSKVGRMIDVLQDWGYTPNLSTSEGGRAARVDLVRCPFLDLAKRNPAVVCGIHRGLISGSMAQLGEVDLEISLTPFVEPDLCHAHLRTRTPFVHDKQARRATTTEEP